MTWDQIELFAERASERAKQDIVLAARTGALGVAIGFSGDDQPLRRLARQLDVEEGPAPPSKSAEQMTEAMSKLAGSGQVRIRTHGADSRRALGPARSPNRRVPRGTPKR